MADKKDKISIIEIKLGIDVEEEIKSTDSESKKIENNK